VPWPVVLRERCDAEPITDWYRCRWWIDRRGQSNYGVLRRIKDGYTLSADFTTEQVKAGEAQVLILPAVGNSQLVSYTPGTRYVERTNTMWGSGHWLAFGAGESAARRAKTESAQKKANDKGERPDEWKASDGPTPASARPLISSQKQPPQHDK
jgi:hypothetical protein